MKVFLGADHRGYEQKEFVKGWLEENGYEVVDVGAEELLPEDDYVDYARDVVEKMDVEEDRGVLLCGSGHGMEMVANRKPGVRAILGFNIAVVKQGREHEDANVLVIPSDWVGDGTAGEMVEAFLETRFSGEERHVRRLEKIQNLRI